MFGVEQDQLDRRKRVYPGTRAGLRALIAISFALLAASLVIVVVRPFFLPDGYSWLSNTISESGGQDMTGNWLLRLALIFVAASVGIIWVLARDIWGRWASAAMALYVISTLGAAIFLDGPWHDGAFNRLEAFLHTSAVVGAGIGFVAGVFLIRLGGSERSERARGFDWLVVAVTLPLPVVMEMFNDFAGLLQRIVVALGYSWWFAEILRVGMLRLRESITPKVS